MTARNGSAPRLLSRDDILAAPDIVRETVEVPEWGGSVIVQGMDVARRVVYSEYMFSADGERKRPSLMGDPALVALCVIDEAGVPLFTLSGSRNSRRSPRSPCAAWPRWPSGCPTRSRPKSAERRFAFRLAGHLGMTVAELGARMSSMELSEWRAFAAEDRFGPLREDERAGVIASMLANPYRAKGREPFVPADFFPSLREPVPPPTSEGLAAKLKAWAATDAKRRKNRTRRVKAR